MMRLARFWEAWDNVRTRMRYVKSVLGLQVEYATDEAHLSNSAMYIHAAYVIALALKDMAAPTPLAVVWERDEELRRRGHRLELVCYSAFEYHMVSVEVGHSNTTQVQMTGARITRDTVCRNATVLVPVVKQLGFKVSVDALDGHLQSFYEYIQRPVSCILY